MSILIDKNSKILVQGITGKEGQFHTKKMLKYGTNIMAGVTPGKFGQEIEGVPVYDTINEALENHEIDASVIFVPKQMAKTAAYEAINARISLIVLLTEGVPVQDAMIIREEAKEKNITLIGPNTPGLVTVDECLVGIMDTSRIQKGNVGVVSRSGTLTTEITAGLLDYGFGQTTVIGIGGDPVPGSTFLDIIKLFDKDKNTKACVLVGEVGGTMEEDAAKYIKDVMDKPVVAYIAGKNVPKGKRLGHAGAIVEGGTGTAENKIKALENAGVRVADVPWEVGKYLKEVF
ncbi:MAG: succinate--CoA ligase subunit alpha [Candidatus Methanofastidiosia archaeon]